MAFAQSLIARSLLAHSCDELDWQATADVSTYNAHLRQYD